MLERWVQPLEASQSAVRIIGMEATRVLSPRRWRWEPNFSTSPRLEGEAAGISFGVLHLGLGQRIPKCRINLYQLHIDDTIRPLSADRVHRTALDVSSSVAATEIGDAVHRLGHPDLSILLLELGGRHALWTRAARQKQGEEKGV